MLESAKWDIEKFKAVLDAIYQNPIVNGDTQSTGNRRSYISTCLLNEFGVADA